MTESQRGFVAGSRAHTQGYPINLISSSIVMRGQEGGGGGTHRRSAGSGLNISNYHILGAIDGIA